MSPRVAIRKFRGGVELRFRLLRSHSRRNDEGVGNALLLEADDFGKANARQELHVEDIFHGSLEFQESNDLAAAQVHHRDAAFQVLAPLGQGHAVHRGAAA